MRSTCHLLLLFFVLCGCTSEADNRARYTSEMKRVQRMISTEVNSDYSDSKIRTVQQLDFDEYGAVTIRLTEHVAEKNRNYVDERSVTFNIKSLSIPRMKIDAAFMRDDKIWLTCKDETPCLVFTPSKKISPRWSLYLNKATTRKEVYEAISSAVSSMR